jgi:FkbM family methyltransferase
VTLILFPVVSLDMGTKSKINTIIKKAFVRCFGLIGVELLTRSDHTANGLQPIVREFFLHQCRGILHIGAHEGQEADMYHRLSRSVIWVEAIPRYFEKLSENIQRFDNQLALNALVAAQCNDAQDFFIASNNGESSSIYPLAGNDYWKGLVNSEVCSLPSRRLDCIFSDFDIRGYDYWIIDVQGAEIEVLKGAGKLLQFCRYLQVEISQETFYEGGAEFQDVKNFLESESFVPLWLPSRAHEEIIFRNLNFDKVQYL